jgi:hypothetical protein
MLSNSLFSIYMNKINMNVYKGESTRDIICLCFDFGSRSYIEEINRLNDIYSKASNDASRQKIQEIINRIELNKDKCIKKSKEEIREDFYQDDVTVEYKTFDSNGEIKKIQFINYKMLYRTPSKAKVGQVMFINEKFYKKAYDWLTMGLGNKMDKNNAKIVEMSAYAPLTTSTIIDTLHIPINDILILKDQDSFFRTMTNVVKAEEYEKTISVLDEEKTELNKKKAIENNIFDSDGNPKYKKSYKKVKGIEKKCVVNKIESEVKNTIWDGMGLIDIRITPDYINGMVLLRNHFFKMCGFKTDIQLFFKDWCRETGNNYKTYCITDMFGVSHRLKDIKIITTNNSIKWLKFKELMGENDLESYKYWCDRVNKDGSLFGVVKTDHGSKLGDVQQMSYQMINTLPCTKEDVREIAKTSVEYVELLKRDNDEFEKFLRKNATEINHYEMMADLYQHNKDFANSKWFRYEKKEVIKGYVYKLRKGKVAVNGDNLTICGNPYALLLYSVGEDWSRDTTLNFEEGTIQCYTTRFEENKYLCAFRNPHNSPNNICYLHNVYNDKLNRYFYFSDNIIAVNCIKSDIQDRANGMDEDSDFFFVSDDDTLVEYAKLCYHQYPTIVNDLKESNITYENTKLAYAEMDNKFAKSRMSIGESSNLAQLAMTYYWSNPSTKDLYDNFVILSVLAQVAIDSCKREFEVDPIKEINRIKNMDCMVHVINNKQNNTSKTKCNLPEFMKYTKEIPLSKNGTEIPYEEVKENRDKLKLRINKNLKCPMNWLEEVLDEIQMADNSNTTPTEDFFIKMNGYGNNRQMSKIREIVEGYDTYIKQVIKMELVDSEFFMEISDETSKIINELKKIKVGNIITFNRIIETALGLEKNRNKDYYKVDNKYTRKLLNLLYKANKEKFLLNFTKKE